MYKYYSKDLQSNSINYITGEHHWTEDKYDVIPVIESNNPVIFEGVLK